MTAYGSAFLFFSASLSFLIMASSALPVKRQVTNSDSAVETLLGGLYILRQISVSYLTTHLQPPPMHDIVLAGSLHGFSWAEHFPKDRDRKRYWCDRRDCLVWYAGEYEMLKRIRHYSTTWEGLHVHPAVSLSLSSLWFWRSFIERFNIHAFSTMLPFIKRFSRVFGVCMLYKRFHCKAWFFLHFNLYCSQPTHELVPECWRKEQELFCYQLHLEKMLSDAFWTINPSGVTPDYVQWLRNHLPESESAPKDYVCLHYFALANKQCEELFELFSQWDLVIPILYAITVTLVKYFYG